MSADNPIKFEGTPDEYRRHIEKIAVKRMYTVARSVIVELGEVWTTQMKRSRFTGYYHGNTQGKKLRARTGALRSSIGNRVSRGKKLDSLFITLRVGGGRAGYAGMQEFGPDGGRITPNKKNGALTVPVYPPKGRALTPTGRLKNAAKLRLAPGRTAKGGPIYTTDMGRAFIVQAKGGGRAFILARKKGARRGGKYDGAVLLYSLRRSVKVPPRLGARNHLDHVARVKFAEMGTRMSEALRTAPGGKQGG